MDIRIIHFYPDLMSLYGSYANVSVLRRALEQLGNTVNVERADLGGAADISGADFLAGADNLAALFAGNGHGVVAVAL